MSVTLLGILLVWRGGGGGGGGDATTMYSVTLAYLQPAQCGGPSEQC